MARDPELWVNPASPRSVYSVLRRRLEEAGAPCRLAGGRGFYALEEAQREPGRERRLAFLALDVLEQFGEGVAVGAAELAAWRGWTRPVARDRHRDLLAPEVPAEVLSDGVVALTARTRRWVEEVLGVEVRLPPTPKPALESVAETRRRRDANRREAQGRRQRIALLLDVVDLAHTLGFRVTPSAWVARFAGEVSDAAAQRRWERLKRRLRREGVPHELEPQGNELALVLRPRDVEAAAAEVDRLLGLPPVERAEALVGAA